MMTLVLVVHSITCILLVLTVLMQAGRGGGLTETFSSAENVFGAQTSAFMVKATSILATVFFVTSLTLALFSARQERSLMDREKMVPAKQTAASQKSVPEPVQEAAQAVETTAAQIPQAEVPAAVSEAVEQTAPALANTQQ